MRVLRAILVLIILLGIVHSAASWPTATHAADLRKGIQPGAPVSDDGLQIWITDTVADQLAATGAGYVRINFKNPWCSDTSEFYNAYNTIIDRLQARGLTVIGLLSNEFRRCEGQAQWNEDAWETGGVDSYNSFIDQFGYQAARVMAHYRNTRGVRYWEIWNEPNCYESQVGVGCSYIYPSIFAQLLGHIYTQVKLYNPLDVVLISGGLLAHNNNGNNQDSAAATYLRATYDYGINRASWSWIKSNTGSYPLDQVGYHLYLSTTGAQLDSDARTYLSWIRSAYATYEGAATSKKLSITEIGWRSDGGYEQLQADNLTTSFNVTLNSSSVALTTWFFVGDSAGWAEKWGLLRDDGSKKPSWYAFTGGSGGTTPTATATRTPTPTRTPTLTATPPPVSGTHLDAFVRGNDGNIYHRYFYNNAWSNWEGLGAPSAGTQGDPGSVSWGSGRVDLFVRGGDNALWTRSFSNGSWGAWSSLGGGLTSAPDAASWGPGHLDVFVRGGDGNIYHRYFYNNAWSNWEGLGAPSAGTQGGPSAVASEVGRVDLFVRGGNNALWTRSFSNGSWGAWSSLGGGLSADPDAASWGAGRVDVVVRGGDNNLYQLTQSNGSWGSWSSLSAPGSGANSSPGVVSSGAGRVDVFVRGSDNALWTRTFSGGGWGAWSSLGGWLSSGPDAASMSN